MREIEFRGKRLDNGEWVYGFYSPVVLPIVGNMGHFINDGGYRAIEIDPATVGQFTGLCDKNGKKIFEGDVVQCRWNRHAGLGWEYDKPELISDMRNVQALEMSDETEVIGSIHDNPELLEVQK